jgi:hypothetical protein
MDGGSSYEQSAFPACAGMSGRAPSVPQNEKRPVLKGPASSYATREDLLEARPTGEEAMGLNALKTRRRNDASGLASAIDWAGFAKPR